MQQEKNRNSQEIISMEEYLCRRQKIREKEGQRGFLKTEEKSPAWIMAELYV